MEPLEGSARLSVEPYTAILPCPLLPDRQCGAKCGASGSAASGKLGNCGAGVSTHDIKPMRHMPPLDFVLFTAHCGAPCPCCPHRCGDTRWGQTLPGTCASTMRPMSHSTWILAAPAASASCISMLVSYTSTTGKEGPANVKYNDRVICICCKQLLSLTAFVLFWLGDPCPLFAVGKSPQPNGRCFCAPLSRQRLTMTYCGCPVQNGSGFSS
jgi:hypothetical protein